MGFQTTSFFLDAFLSDKEPDDYDFLRHECFQDIYLQSEKILFIRIHIPQRTSRVMVGELTDNKNGLIF